jgi:hypothetical protein
MLLMGVDSISRSRSILGFESAFGAQFCSWYHKLFRALYLFPQFKHSKTFWEPMICIFFFTHIRVGFFAHFFSWYQLPVLVV